MKVRIKLNIANAIITGTKEVITTDLEGIETISIVNVYDWVPALKLAAQEIQILNIYSGTLDFPFPVNSNHDAMIQVDDLNEGGLVIGSHWEGDITGFLGNVNGLPSDDGRLEVEILNYEYMDLDRFPVMPTTFFFSEGVPPTAGKII